MFIRYRRALFCSSATRRLYRVEKDSSGASTLQRRQDVVELNLKQFRSAHENVYFSSSAHVQTTLTAFRKHSSDVRPPRPTLKKYRVGQRTIVEVFCWPFTAGKTLATTKVGRIRYAVKTGRYKVGDGWVRDPVRVQVVKAELDRLQALREKAINKEEGGKTWAVHPKLRSVVYVASHRKTSRHMLTLRLSLSTHRSHACLLEGTTRFALPDTKGRSEPFVRLVSACSLANPAEGSRLL